MYAELHAYSNFSFLKGASRPQEMVSRATELNYAALAITDECSVAGVVRAHREVKKNHLPLHLIVGAELKCDDGLTVVALAKNRQGYGRLCRLISRARRAAAKGSYFLRRVDLADTLSDCCLIWLPSHTSQANPEEEGLWIVEHFKGHAWIGAELHQGGDDAGRLHELERLSARFDLPLTACGGALMHGRERKALHDTMTAIRLNKTVAECGYALQPNAERYLRDLPTLRNIYPQPLLAESLRIAQCCTFSLDELRYQYPSELVPEGETAASWLRKLVRRGARTRWPEGVPKKVKKLLKQELQLIGELRYESFFLTVQDLVRAAKKRKILCQGRGSAANSAVCYCLGVTAVDPSQQEVLFERFLSKERNEPPDIDVDFEHERREEIIQYIYKKYGRHRAGIAATVISYRLRSSLRDVGKALGLDALQLERVIRAFNRRGGKASTQDRSRWLKEAGFDPQSPVIRNLLTLATELYGFPRHLSQHVGGFVIAADCLEELVPIENAAMEGRTVIQWDKNDLEDLGLLKVDVLALGMLTAIRRSLDFYNAWHGRQLTLAGMPKEDRRVYEMIQRADTIGVFQIESRAQMSMLPRLRPKKFYDLVVEIAIVRPGPIQGDMVHPYLRRRAGEERTVYPDMAVYKVLHRTKGVPIFQEQVMRLAMVAAGFKAGEADELRRAMASWEKAGSLEPYRVRLLKGFRDNGYSEEFAQRLFNQIRGFGEYGFPESHSASFASLAYASSWLKRYAPAEFTAGLLNSQPMGFYQPAQLIRDAREHGVEVRPVDVKSSDWQCTLESGGGYSPALRLGLRLVKGLSKSAAHRIMAARNIRPFTNAQDLALRSQLRSQDLESLAAADALIGIAGNRHQAAWALAGIDMQMPLFKETPMREAIPLLRVPTEGQNIVADYHSVGLTLRRHPMALLRERFLRRNALTALQLQDAGNDVQVRTAGLVLARQNPGTSNNTTFVTLEDETGIVNLIVWQRVAERYRQPFLQSRLLEVRGKLQHQSDVMHLIAEELIDRSAWLGRLQVKSREFH